MKKEEIHLLNFFTIDEFTKTIKENIVKWGSWVGELEATMFCRFLETKCNIIIDIYVEREPKSLLPKTISHHYVDYNCIYLYNENDNHYKYFALEGDGQNMTIERRVGPEITTTQFIGSGKKRSKRKTRRYRLKH